jgi:CRP-like cAMP-binding protein
MAPQPSIHLPLLNRASQAYEPGRVARVGPPPWSLENTPSSFRNQATTQGRTPLRGWALFSGISSRGREEIVRVARKCEFRRGHTVHVEGDPVRQVVLLMSGSAKLVQLGQNGTEVILRLCGPGELVGTLGIASQCLHCATAQALRPCEALVWDIRGFDLLFQRFQELRLNTALILVKQLKDMDDRFREICTECAASRLSHQIMRLIDQVGYRKNGAVQIDISREELAQLIGTTMYTVSRLVAEWDKKGIVRAGRGTVSVQNLKELEHLSQNIC